MQGIQHVNPYLKPLKSSLAEKPALSSLILIVLMYLGFVFSKIDLSITIALSVLPVVLILVFRIVIEPEFGLTFAYVINFFLMGIPRYIPMDIGYYMDGLLLLIYISFFFKYFYFKVDWSPVKNDLFYLMSFWLIYICLQVLNPEAVSFQAWMAAMRSLALYPFLIMPLIFMLYNKPKHLDRFILIWGIISSLASLKGIGQLVFGLDSYEQAWMNSGAYKTHILFGQLRVFSFYTDAGQFGAAQAHVALIAILLTINAPNQKSRILWLTIAILNLWGYAISGTRGALAVIMAGAALYIILSKNVKVIVIGASVLFLLYGFLKFTTIGNGNYQINRIRTGLSSDDPSLQLRLQNQRTLAAYLESRPFGAGVGHSGSKARKFIPYSYLATIATDSWYVIIWAELGVVGLMIHFFVMFYILGKGMYIVMFKIKNKDLKVKLDALLCGYFGILTANYGNAVINQFPTWLMLYSSLAFIWLGPSLDKILENEKRSQKELNSSL